MDPIPLYFHHVGAGVDHYTSIALDSFERMLDRLQSAAEIVDLMHGGGSEPTFALTFDDGYEATFGRPLEVLESRGIPATFFVVPQWLGRRAPHSWAPADLWCADAATLRDAQDRGFGIASHTWSHQALDVVTDSEVRSELDRGWASLAQHGLGGAFQSTVAYPYGRLPRNRPPGLSRGFATNNQPQACWRCRPLAITRVYLADDEDWTSKIAGWIEASRTAASECGDPDHRAVGIDRQGAL